MFYGNVNTTTKYVCDNGVFRTVNGIEVEADSTCTSYNRNEYYILPKYDGEKNYSYYMCTESGWILTTEKLNLGSMIDERDGHEYKIIGIKSQMWMAENLDYKTDSSFCYNNSVEYCAKYGRLYTWATAVGELDETCGYGKECNLKMDEKGRVKGVCPDGWHLPITDEWIKLGYNVDSSLKDEWWDYYDNSVGKILKSTSWNGLDSYGFSVLPAGYRDLSYVYWGDCEDEEYGCEVRFWGALASFWNASGDDGWYAETTLINGNFLNVGTMMEFNANSVRCVKDEE